MSSAITNYGASTSSKRDASQRLSTSVKGKGKVRATDDEVEDGHAADSEASDAEDAAAKGLSFCIRFTDGTTEDLLDLYVNDGEAVRDVKRRIRIRRPALATNRLRLIYFGRVLGDGVRLVPYMTSLLKRQREQEQRDTRGKIGDLIEDVVNRAVHSLDDTATSPTGSSDTRHNQHSRKASMNPFEGRSDSKGVDSTKDKGKGKQLDEEPDKSATDGRKVWLHCSVGEPGSLTEELESATEQQQPAQNAPLAGFDRLREAGFSEEEIATMRAQFHTDGPSDTVVTGDEDEHARALEEQWMDNLGTNAGGDMTSPNADTYETLFKGLIAGFFFPFLPLFFFRAAEGEPSVFSKKMQMGIVAGLSINLLYGALRAIS